MTSGRERRHQHIELGGVALTKAQWEMAAAVYGLPHLRKEDFAQLLERRPETIKSRLSELYRRTGVGGEGESAAFMRLVEWLRSQADIRQLEETAAILQEKWARKLGFPLRSAARSSLEESEQLQRERGGAYMQVMTDLISLRSSLTTCLAMGQLKRDSHADKFRLDCEEVSFGHYLRFLNVIRWIVRDIRPAWLMNSEDRSKTVAEAIHLLRDIYTPTERVALLEADLSDQPLPTDLRARWHRLTQQCRCPSYSPVPHCPAHLMLDATSHVIDVIRNDWIFPDESPSDEADASFYGFKSNDDDSQTTDYWQ